MSGRNELEWCQGVKKQYRPRIAPAQWESHKTRIVEHYQASTLEETRIWMDHTLDLHVS